MPKAKTMLDELARVLKARKNAVNRFDRRASSLAHGLYWPKDENNMGRLADSFFDAVDARDESKRLVRDLDDRAVMEYDRLMRSNPSRRDMQKAFRMMPGSIVREHDYFDR